MTEQVKKTIDRQQQMFASVERYLPVRLREHLKEKITREQEALAALTSRAETAKRLAENDMHLLPRTFFIQKSIDTHIYE